MQILTTQNDQFLDSQNRTCSNGYIYVLDIKNLSEIDVYTLTDSEYVRAANPIRLDLNGRPNQTYFTETLAYCRLYDADNVFVREWYGSSLSSPVINDTVVYTLANLRKAAPSLKSVTVIGYWTDTDVGPRNYVWREGITSSADDGLVVKSDLTESGRWLLSTDLAYIPSTYYGVYQGHEGNILKFLARPNFVYDTTYPTCNFFVSGKYTTSTGLATLHPVMLDRGVTFAANYLSAASFKLIGKQTSDAAIGKLKSKAAVRSSWYDSLDDMFTSGSLDMTIDTPKKMLQDVELKNVAIHGKNTATYVWSGLLTLNDCIIDADVFSGLEKLKFLNMDFCDTYFYAKNLFELTNIQATSVAKLSKFKSADMYLRAVLKYTTPSDLWLESRKITIDVDFPSTLQTLHDMDTSAAVAFNSNCHVYDSFITSATVDTYSWLTFTNTTVSNFSVNIAARLMLEHSIVNHYSDPNGLVEYISMLHSVLGQGEIPGEKTLLDFTSSTIAADIKGDVWSGGNYSLRADNCRFMGNIVLKNAQLTHCIVGHAKISGYTRQDGVFGMQLSLIGNHIGQLVWDDTIKGNDLDLVLDGNVFYSVTRPHTGTEQNPYIKTINAYINGNICSEMTPLRMNLNRTKLNLTKNGNYYITQRFNIFSDKMQFSDMVRPATTECVPLYVGTDATTYWDKDQLIKVIYNPSTFDGTVVAETPEIWTYIVAIPKNKFDTDSKWVILS